MAWTEILLAGDSPTNLTGTAYRLLYTDSTGAVQELAHGTATYVLTSNGAPSGRATVEVGAVEWNVTYSTEVEPTPDAFNKLAYTSEPPTPNAWNQLKQDSGTGWIKMQYG